MDPNVGNSIIDLSKTIIIDHGSYLIKVGVASDKQPKIVTSSLSGNKRKTISKAMMMPGQGASLSDGMVFGDDAINQANVMRLEPTIDDRSFIKESSKNLYSKLFKDLRILDDLTTHPDNFNVIYLVSSFANKNLLHQIFKIFTQDFKIKHLCILPQAIAIVNNFNSDDKCFDINTSPSGIVIDIGETTTDVVAVYLNHILQKCSNRLNIGSADLHLFLKEFYEDHEYFKYFSILKLKQLKENSAVVSLNYEKELNEFNIKNTPKIPFDVEDNIYEFGVELIKAGEILFDPKIVKKDCDGVINAIIKSYDGLDDVETKQNIFRHIFVTGGGSKLKNLKTRVKMELEKFIPNDEIKFKLFTFENEEAAWQGAQKMAEKKLLEKLFVDVSGMSDESDFNFEIFNSLIDKN
jgi:actin-related protein